MLGITPKELPQVIGFVLLPRFSMIAFTAAVEVMRQANRLSGRELYQWPLFTIDGSPVAASNGLLLTPAGDLEAASKLQTVALCGGVDVQKIDDRRLMSWLRWMDRQGRDIGAICTAPYILARAGLLDEVTCTIHWENLAAFVEEFPELDVTNELFEIDRKRFTCAGGTAPLDMMLNVVAKQHGHELAAAVAEQFMHERIRNHHDHQRMSLPARLGVRHPKLLSVIATMEQHLEERCPAPSWRGGGPVHAPARAALPQVSEPLARALLSELRLNRRAAAADNLSVIDVALACGFVSASHFQVLP